MAQDYDNMGKKLWADYAEDLSRFVLNIDNVEVLADLDTEQQIIERQTDITKHIRINNHEAILHVELQLRDSTDSPMWARNAQYQGYLVGKYQIPVYSNVIYFHPRAGRNDPGGYTYKWHGYEHTNRYKVIRLIEIEGEPILEMQAPGILPFTPLMKPPAGMDLERWVQECINATRATPVDQQADLLYGLSLFGSIRHDPQLFKERIPEELMQESKFYQLMLKETTIEYILALLEQQFHTEAVRALTPMLRNIDDLERLKELHLAAARVPNIETFAQKLID
ncbi:hypothetical protein F4Y59_08695 [Candidatus Poribacteria bacterium]|nr:hypothetical protein [Candidatus Poribacteria bacterium]MYK17050.1 hypothetical protein [Candidatus Poribacteria bacterium]